MVRTVYHGENSISSQTTQYDMTPHTLQTTGGKDPYKYNTTQTTQHDMSPPTLQTSGGKDPYK